MKNIITLFIAFVLVITGCTVPNNISNVNINTTNKKAFSVKASSALKGSVSFNSGYPVGETSFSASDLSGSYGINFNYTRDSSGKAIGLNSYHGIGLSLAKNVDYNPSGPGMKSIGVSVGISSYSYIHLISSKNGIYTYSIGVRGSAARGAYHRRGGTCDDYYRDDFEPKFYTNYNPPVVFSGTVTVSNGKAKIKLSLSGVGYSQSISCYGYYGEDKPASISGDFSWEQDVEFGSDDKINVSLGSGVSCGPEDPESDEDEENPEEDDKELSIDPTNDLKPWTALVNGSSLSGIGDKKVKLDSNGGFNTQSLSTPTVEVYYTEDPSKKFFPPSVIDPDLFLAIQQLEALMDKIQGYPFKNVSSSLSGFTTQAMSTEKNQRRLQALDNQKDDSISQLQNNIIEINQQVELIGREIDKVSQARYYIGRPSDADPTALFNKYKQQIKDLTDEFTYLSESENTHSLVEATANLLKQMQIYTFLVNDYISDNLPQSINNTTESSDYLDKIQSPQALIRFLQHNISTSQVKIQSENDKLKATMQELDNDIALFNQGLTDVDNEISDIKTHLTPEEIAEVESEFNISSFSTKSAASAAYKILVELGKVTVKYGSKGYKWGLRETKNLSKRFKKELDDFFKKKDDISKKECKPLLLDTQRSNLIRSAKSPELKKAINEMYRPTAGVGNGSTADKLRNEIEKGLKLDHLIKAKEKVKQLEKMLERTKPSIQKPDNVVLSPKDRDIAQHLINDLKNAIGDR